jgi:hypothetical protein
MGLRLLFPYSMVSQVEFDTQRTFEMLAMHVAIQAVISLSAFGSMSGIVGLTAIELRMLRPYAMGLQVGFDAQRNFEMPAMHVAIQTKFRSARLASGQASYS